MKQTWTRWVFAVLLLLNMSSNAIPVLAVPDLSVNITICHIPPGNPDNAQTITIDTNALEAHLDHGDYLGECREVRHAS